MTCSTTRVTRTPSTSHRIAANLSQDARGPAHCARAPRGPEGGLRASARSAPERRAGRARGPRGAARLAAGAHRALPDRNACGRCSRSRASARRSTRPGWPTSTRPRRRSMTSRGCRRWSSATPRTSGTRSSPRPTSIAPAPSGCWPSSAGSPTRRGALQVFSSGGSSGVRGVYVWDWEQFVTLACLAWRWQVRAERAAGSDRRPARLAVLEAGEPPHASTPLFDVATGPLMETVVIPAAAPFDQVRRAVADARPTHLVGYASVIGRLARAAIAGELDIRPVRVSTNSEPLSEEDRDAIDHAWGAPVHNLWGSTEIGVQAVGCGQDDGLHICEDEVILERVDADGRPVGPDEPAARTLATGLAGRTFPFIRYDLGDEVTLLPGALRVRQRDAARRRHRRTARRRLPLRRADDPGERVPVRAGHRPADLGVPGAPDRGRGGRARGRVARRRRGGRGAGRLAGALRPRESRDQRQRRRADPASTPRPASSSGSSR